MIPGTEFNELERVQVLTDSKLKHYLDFNRQSIKFGPWVITFHAFKLNKKGYKIVFFFIKASAKVCEKVFDSKQWEDCLLR